jgi:hypothetical protein
MSGVVTLEPTGAGTRMTVLAQFVAEQMEEMIGGGMDQGMRQAIGRSTRCASPSTPPDRRPTWYSAPRPGAIQAVTGNIQVRVHRSVVDRLL